MQRSEKFVKIASNVSTFSFMIAVGVAAFLFFGFINFTISISKYESDEQPEADAIIVLTGGEARLETGLRLLEQKFANRMLISGVNPRTSDQAIVSQYMDHKPYFACCIDMDRSAKNTSENASQSAQWIKTNKYKSIILVTSKYHMPRAMLEFTRNMPKLKIYPQVASQEANNAHANVGSADHLNVLVKEYAKTLYISFAMNFPGNASGVRNE